MIEYRSVYSSHVAEVGYDKETGDLHVIWTTGKHSVYEGVPPDEFDSVSTDFSVGKAVHRIKQTYKHRYE